MKVKFADYQQITHSRTQNKAIQELAEIVADSFHESQRQRPSLIQRGRTQRAQQVLLCTHAPTDVAGRCAQPRDKAALQAYAAAYLAERGSGSLDYPWDQCIQQRRVAVLEHEGQIVAVVRRGETVRCAIVVAPFTFPQFRRQGFARRLLAFLCRKCCRSFLRSSFGWMRRIRPRSRFISRSTFKRSERVRERLRSSGLYSFVRMEV